MTTYIIEIPLEQTNENADTASAAQKINGISFSNAAHLSEVLRADNIDKYYPFTIANHVAHINNGNDNFGNCYVAYVNY